MKNSKSFKIKSLFGGSVLILAFLLNNLYAQSQVNSKHCVLFLKHHNLNLIPIFEQKRQFAMTEIEINQLMALTEGTAHENEYARNVLTFFADKTFIPNYSSLSSIGESTFENNSQLNSPQDIYTVYPNPSNGSLNIQLPSNHNNENMSIIITNIMGVKVYEDTKYSNQKPIDISTFTNGMYLLSISQNGITVFKTIISKL